MLAVGVTARPHPGVVGSRGTTVPVNHDQRTAPWLGTDGCRPGCADIESETELTDLVEQLAQTAADTVRARRQAIEAGARNTRQQLGLDDDLSGWPE